MRRAPHPLKRRFVSDDQRVPMPTQHQKPCSDCPWTRTSLRGWLGAYTAEQWIQLVHSEAYIDCHCTTNRQCAGAAMFRDNVCKLVKSEAILKLNGDTKLVFENDAEFLKHHQRK